MAMNDDIQVVEQSAPRITKQLLDFRNDAISSTATFGINSSDEIIDVTDYTFQLVIKRVPQGIRAQDGRPQVYDDDSTQMKYDGTILSAEDGTFYFQLDAAATCCYGTYVAEIRWWSDTADTAGPPTDRVLVRFIVSRRLSSTYP